MPPMVPRLVVAPVVAVLVGCAPSAQESAGVPAALERHLVAFYDFEHPDEQNPAIERDLGLSSTPLWLVNGGAAMRVADGAHAGSTLSLQSQQVNPDSEGNDDWKAGVYDGNGVTSLSAFGPVAGITLTGWVKPTGANPGLNTTTAAPDDHYGAIGLFGVLAGDSDGHGVRALVEVIDVSGALRLAALGRRVDGDRSLVLAADEDWHTLLPDDTWTHIAAMFDFDNGTMALYSNGEPVDATYTSSDDAWDVGGPPEPDQTSPTTPAGIKIGGSYPQNTAERNPFTGRFDDLMFFDRVLAADEVARIAR